MVCTYYVGIDGGGSKCAVRVEDERGQLIGRAVSGPANIRLSVEQAWHSIYQALQQILPNHQDCHLHVGAGLAGCELPDAYQKFINHPHQFTSLILTSDAHAACLGAHQGEAGAVIILGTGVVGYQIEGDSTTKIGGWGFPHDDMGSGAWLGLEAIRLTLQALDKRIPHNPLTEAIYAHFQLDFSRVLSWANQANMTAFAELAPIVVTQSQQGESQAIQLLQKSAESVDRIAKTLLEAQNVSSSALPCALVGGMSSFIEPYLSEHLRKRLRPCLTTPEAGAIQLIRYFLKEKVTYARTV